MGSEQTGVAAVAPTPTAGLIMSDLPGCGDAAVCLQEDSWPAQVEALVPCAPEEGSCLDRQHVECLREQIASGVSSAHSAHSAHSADIHEGARKTTATAAGSAGQSVLNSLSADSDNARAVGGSETEALNSMKPKSRASGGSSAAAYRNTGPTGVAGEEAGQQAGTQEAEWQLTSLSRKALSSGRTRSSSLVQSSTRLHPAISCCGCLLLLNAMHSPCWGLPERVHHDSLPAAALAQRLCYYSMRP